MEASQHVVGVELIQRSPLSSPPPPISLNWSPWLVVDVLFGLVKTESETMPYLYDGQMNNKRQHLKRREWKTTACGDRRFQYASGHLLLVNTIYRSPIGNNHRTGATTSISFPSHGPKPVLLPTRKSFGHL
jgi:hypothetical protein